MRQFGLIGFPLSHSFSKGYFTDKFLSEDRRDCHYENFPLRSIHELPDLITDHPDLVGLNVTIPYKEDVIPYLDEMDKDARAIGAVNTIRLENDKLRGFNTDHYGFAASLKPILPDHPVKAFILGTGGASKAVAYSLEQLEIEYTFVSRINRENAISYESLTKKMISETHLIINTSPLGMYPEVEHCPEIPYDGIGSGHILYDLIYNPEVTQFLKEGEHRGASIKNGLEMLHLQAEKAWEIWNDS